MISFKHGKKTYSFCGKDADKKMHDKKVELGLIKEPIKNKKTEVNKEA